MACPCRIGVGSRVLPRWLCDLPWAAGTTWRVVELACVNDAGHRCWVVEATDDRGRTTRDLFADEDLDPVEG